MIIFFRFFVKIRVIVRGTVIINNPRLNGRKKGQSQVSNTSERSYSQCVILLFYFTIQYVDVTFQYLLDYNLLDLFALRYMVVEREGGEREERVGRWIVIDRPRTFSRGSFEECAAYQTRNVSYIKRMKSRREFATLFSQFNKNDFVSVNVIY